MSYREITFEQALEETKDGERTILLGNGFSRSIWSNFSYEYLHQEARTATNSWAKYPDDTLDNLFKFLDTTDFEKVLAYLNVSIQVANCYPENDYKELLKKDKKELIDSFIAALKAVHPEYKYDVMSELNSEFYNFISHFNNIFTVNYDLLLYWIINQSYINMNSINMNSLDLELVSPTDNFKDGFRKKNGKIIWDGYSSNKNDQNVYYLHGSIFIFIENENLFKLHNQGKYTISQQIQKYLESGKTPLIILEGKYTDKLKIIQNHPYFYHAFTSLGMIKDYLFIYGFSLNEHSDMHIIEQINKSKCKNIYLSNYEDQEDELKRKAKLLTKGSSQTKKVNIFVFNSCDAINWLPKSSTNL